MKAFATVATLASASASLLPAGLPLTYTNQAYAAGYLPGAYNAAPLIAAPAAAAPVVAAAVPAAPVASQYQAQDEFGNLNYGYSNINSAKQEVGNAYGGVTGSYQYIDANGLPQRVDYIADALGFRVKATNLPVGPAVPEAVALVGPEPVVYTGVAPAPVEDTEEVKAAKAEFLAAFEEAKNREKRSVVAPLALGAYPYAAGFQGLVAHPNGAVVPVDEPAVALAKAEHLTAKFGALPLAAAPLAATYAATYAAAPLAAAPLAATYATAPIAAPLAAPAIAAAPFAAAPLAAAYAAPAAAVVPSAPASREATLTQIKLPNALVYRVD